MTKSPRKNVPDVGIELGAARMPSELASDRATAPGSEVMKPPMWAYKWMANKDQLPLLQVKCLGWTGETTNVGTQVDIQQASSSVSSKWSDNNELVKPLMLAHK